jgi:uncharacterized protein YegL
MGRWKVDFSGGTMTKDYTQVPYSDVPDTQPFGFADEFVENAEPRCPCVLLLDTSGSMHGDPINQLNAGLASFKEELMADSLAAKRVEVSIVTFGPVQVHNPFQTADAFQPATLSAGGDTPMGAAIAEAIRLVEERKRAYTAGGVSYYRPWIFLITDGGPTDAWQQAAAALRTAVDQRKLAFFAVAVEGADMNRLTQISPRKPLMLRGLRFRELFSWLSNSLGAVSRSSPKQEDTLMLPPPSSDWTRL